MATLVKQIKDRIKDLLEELRDSGTLGEVYTDDYKQGIFDRDYSAYPAAILTSPAIEGSAFTNRQNERVHTFEIIFVQKGENVKTATDIEDLIETILNKFDNDPTLDGKADGGVEPSTSSPQAVVSRGKSYIAFSVRLRAKAIKDLTFS